VRRLHEFLVTWLILAGSFSFWDLWSHRATPGTVDDASVRKMDGPAPDPTPPPDNK
jgi:hypothetical protein